jgi:hypothetical protein
MANFMIQADLIRPLQCSFGIRSGDFLLVPGG